MSPEADRSDILSLLELPKAILFDMDGTLTKPLLDFPLIKKELGIGDRPILEAISEMSPTDRVAAEAILCRHEETAAAASTLNEGCIELLSWLLQHRVRMALITRNSRASVQTVLERHPIPINTLIAREDALPKPDPAPLLLACQRLEISPGEVWMVGDGRYDVEAGTAAGIRTVWLSHGRQRHFPTEPWLEVISLVDLLARLQNAG